MIDKLDKIRMSANDILGAPLLTSLVRFGRYSI